MDLSSQKVVLAFAALSLRAFLSAIQKEKHSNKKRPAEYQPDIFSLVILEVRRSRGRARRASPRRSAGWRTPPRRTEEQAVDGLRAFGTGFLFSREKRDGTRTRCFTNALRFLLWFSALVVGIVQDCFEKVLA